MTRQRFDDIYDLAASQQYLMRVHCACIYGLGRCNPCILRDELIQIEEEAKG